MNKGIIIFLLIFIVAALAGVIGDLDSRITTYQQCEDAGWLVRSITVYDSPGGSGSIEKECVLWSGKKFVKLNSGVPLFPTQKKPAASYMQALLSDKPEELVLEHGCIRAGGYLIVWPYGFSLRTGEEERFQVINSTGHFVARIGDKIIMGGGADESGDIAGNYSAQLPFEGCTGPYWIAGEITRTLELTDDQKKAYEIAVAPISYPTEIVEVKSLECTGCFSITLQRTDNQKQFTIMLNDWKITNTTY